MASVKGGLVPGSELTADSVSWRRLAQRPWTVSERYPRASGSRNQGTDKPASTGCLTLLRETLETLQECLQLQPRDDQSKQPEGDDSSPGKPGRQNRMLGNTQR